MATKPGEQRSIYSGMNTGDVEYLHAFEEEVEKAKDGPTQRRTMEHLLFARHLLDSLLRRMQDT